ncbi:hypothetical protein GCM10008915_65260 [Bifidobacterium pullorum subsp. gallinarum]
MQQAPCVSVADPKVIGEFQWGDWTQKPSRKPDSFRLKPSQGGRDI